MDHEGTIIRPPSEAGSILLQVTLGCSHNKCAFCGAYKDKRFGFRDESRFESDLAFAHENCRRQRRVFLCDGDALIMPMDRLRHIMQRIREELPWVTRVGTYANAKALTRKSLEELQELRELGLGIVYMGLESGDDETLQRMCKGVDVSTMIEQGRKVREAGLKLNVTVLAGLAGPERSMLHAELTGRAITAMDPHQVAVLTLMVIPGTPLHGMMERDEFELLSADGMLRELKVILEHTELTRGLFLANHASNYLPIKARLPRDKEQTLDDIDIAIEGGLALRPEWARAL